MSDPLTGVNKGAPEILARLVANFEGLAERTLAPADPIRFLFGAVATALAQAHSLIDFNARSNLIRHARGEYLDEVVRFHGVTRLAASKASAIVRFSLATTRSGAVVIPAGTRVTTLAGTPVFATTAYADIPAGSLYADVTVECAEAGKLGNGYTAGQLSILVDPIAYVVSVANTDTTSGGDSVEEDEDLQDRAILALDALSTAGPSDAYEALAKSANPSIIDVKVLNPTPGEVRIYALLEGGEIPGETVLAQVEEACSPKTARPLTDQVTVAAPEEEEYSIYAQYWLPSSALLDLPAAQARVEAAAEAYRDWQQGAIGRDINPFRFFGFLREAGVTKIGSYTPGFEVEVGEDTVGQCASLALDYMGIFDE